MPAISAAAPPAVRGPLAYAAAHQGRFLTELMDFVRLPSVSGQPRHAADMRRCAAWLVRHLRRIGLDRVQVVPTPRHPLVYAEWRRAPTRPTVLIYGHYDVQPVDPLAAWRTPPFAPVVRGAHLYGRGAADDKGQLWAHVKALESYLATERTLPVNVICLFEGEEEIGSPNLLPLLEHYHRRLGADVAVVSDTRILGPDRPAIIYALRGGLGFDLTVHGPRQDLHSGSFGGAVHNPLQALADILASLHDAQGRIRIPGFYEQVRPARTTERTEMACWGPSNAQIRQDAGIARDWGEPGYTLYERTTLRPALTINGLSGGYRGPGGKAVIPAQARAKISFRLVPDQDPREIEQLVRRHLARITPPTVCTTLRTTLRSRPALIDRRHPALRAAAWAYRQGFGAPAVFLRSGGSIPVVNSFQTILGIPTVLMGFALPDSRMHAPNERLHLPTFYRAIATCIWFLTAAGALRPAAPARGAADDH